MKDTLGNLPVLIGLAQQGHIPTIERMLSEGASWGAIGKAINWEPTTAKKHYAAYAAHKAGRYACENCIFRREDFRDGGWCYFWKNQSGPCLNFEDVQTL